MYRNIRIRLGGILLIVFMALFFNFRDLEFYSYHYTGVCEDYDWWNSVCHSGEELLKRPTLQTFTDIPTFLIVSGITMLGSFYTKGDKILKLERASHLAKDAGEFTAALGAVFFFGGVFNEAQMALGFGIVFLAYFYGHGIGIILQIIANHLKTTEEYEASQ